MYDFPKVGPEQERLSLFTGEWDSQVRFYFDPSLPPMEKIGRYTAKLDLGGYFLHREFEVQLDDAGTFAELAFHGRGLTGYDPFARKYLGVWAEFWKSGLVSDGRRIRLYWQGFQRGVGGAGSWG